MSVIRDDAVRQVLDRQRWVCVECREAIVQGEELAYDRERGLAHFTCITTYYAPAAAAASSQKDSST